MKSIVFIMPGSGRKPIGGYKVVFEYANRIAALGNEVTVQCSLGEIV